MLATTVATRRTGGEGPVGMLEEVDQFRSTVRCLRLATSILPVSDVFMGYY